MKSHRTGWWPLAAVCAVLSGIAAADDSLQEIVITASLRGSSAADLPQSVTVLDAATLQAAGVQHFEDVLAMIPNLSWASGSSRPRFFLMRGIGEVEQYQGAPNPSVGFLIDDIDFSGVGMPATLFDTRQIEVLRGPQGTVYGANALAGLINVRTEDPTAQFSLHGEATVGDYQTRAAGVALSDSLEDGAAGRVLGMDDPTGAMAAFAPIVQTTAVVPVEGNAEFVDQQLFHRLRTGADELLDRGRIGRAVARHHDVASQGLRIGCFGIVDDPALRPRAVRRERALEREQFDGETVPGRPQRIGAAGQTGSDHQTIGADDFHGMLGDAVSLGGPERPSGSNRPPARNG